MQAHTPVNRFPGFVEELIRSLRCALPTMGKARLASVLARAGLRIAPTTVARFLKRRPPSSPPPPAPVRKRRPTTAGRRVFARYPQHVWHVDLTVVPTFGGLWAPWVPPSIVQRWPFAWWVAVVVDHYSRAVVGFALFRKQPSAEQAEEVLDAAITRAGRAPRHLVSDQGPQFRDGYRGWCRRAGIRPRFGAIGKKGSIAVVERFIRSMKDEHFRKIVVPLNAKALRAGLHAYVRWYNEERPRSTLDGETPNERLHCRSPARDEPGFETRPAYPRRGRHRVRGLDLVITATVGWCGSRADERPFQRNDSA